MTAPRPQGPKRPEAKKRRLAWEVERIAEARAEFDAGLYVTSDEMKAWIDSIGTDHALPPPILATRVADLSAAAALAGTCLRSGLHCAAWTPHPAPNAAPQPSSTKPPSRKKTGSPGRSADRRSSRAGVARQLLDHRSGQGMLTHVVERGKALRAVSGAGIGPDPRPSPGQALVVCIWYASTRSVAAPARNGRGCRRAAAPRPSRRLASASARAGSAPPGRCLRNSGSVEDTCLCRARHKRVHAASRVMPSTLDHCRSRARRSSASRVVASA